MPKIDRTIQNFIAPYAWLVSAVLWGAAWLEILTHGKWHLHFDCTKFYLAVIAGYAGAAELSKWSVTNPTDPQQDPVTEKLQRGMFFIWLWTTPFLFTILWQIQDPSMPLPVFVEKIPMGLIGIYLLKQASRQMRHRRHGVIEDQEPVQMDLETEVHTRIAAQPEGMKIGEIVAAFSKVSRPTLYRVLNNLTETHRLTRTGKPRTPDVRYLSVSQ